MANAAILSVLVTANTNQATRSLLRFNTTLRATESSSNKALGAMSSFAKGATLGVGAGLAYAVKKAADFEQQLDSLGSVTSANARQMELFRKQAMKAGADTKFSALEAAVAQTELAKGGLSVRNIMRGGLRSALSLAAAGELELGEAATFTVNAMKLFSIGGKDSQKVADALATAANATTADVRDFGMALQQGGTSAKAAGLSFTETVATLEALASIGIKNTDAGTSLKTTFAQLATPTAKASALMKDLNLQFFDSHGNIKSIVDISAMLRDRFSGLTKEQRLQAAATLAGTDGMRTLLALFDVGPNKLQRFEQGLTRQGSAADVAAKKQDNLKGKLENLQGSVETLAIAFGSKLLPVLTSVAEDVTDVLNDRTLSSAEKFDRLGQMAGHALAEAGPVVAKAAAKLAETGVRAFFTAFRESPLWFKLLTSGFILSKLGGFSAFKKVGIMAGSQMATGVGEGVATSARAGRFARAGAAFKAIGVNVLGAALVAGIADAATRQGISGFGDRFQQVASTATFGLIPSPRDVDERMRTIVERINRWRSKVKLSDPNDPSNSLIRAEDLNDFSKRQRRMLAGMVELRNRANNLFGPGTQLKLGAWTDPGRALKNIQQLQNSFFQLRAGTVDNLRDLRAAFDRNMGAIAATLGNRSKEGRRAVRENFELAFEQVKRLERRKVISVEEAEKEIARLTRTYTKRAKDGGVSNFELFQRAIKDTMSRSQSISARGLAVIQQQFLSATKLYGLRPSEAFKGLGKTLRSAPKLQPVPGQQRGGHIAEGKPSGDSVPAMLEKGEYVLNRNAVSKVGRERLDALNFGAAKRFQSGGLAGPHGTGSGFIPLANFLHRRFGLQMTAGRTDHAYRTIDGNVSDHSWGGAGDFSNGSSPTPQMDAAASWATRTLGHTAFHPGSNSGPPALKQLLYRTLIGGNHFNHVHVALERLFAFSPERMAALIGGGVGGGFGDIGKLMVKGTDSPLKAIVQATLNATRDAATRRLSALAGTLDPGAVGSGASEFAGMGGTVAANVKLGRRMAAQYGWKGPEFDALYKLWQGESGWDSNARASSGAFGIPQALPATKMPLAAQQGDAASQIAWGLQYIKGRYGDPSSAYGAWLSRFPHWYAKGGGVGHLGALVNKDPSKNPPGSFGGKTLPGPGLAGTLSKTLRVLHSGGSAKKRGQAIQAFLKKLRKQGGLPEGLSKQLGFLSTSATTLGDYADKASQLNVDNDDGTTTLGAFRGKNEQGWVSDQLSVLFQWRNKLVDAIKTVQERRKAIAKMVAKAQARVAHLSSDIKSVSKHQVARRKQLAELRKHPKQNKAKIEFLRKAAMTVERWLGARGKERSGVQRLLGDRTSGKGLLGRQAGLGTLYGDLTGEEGLAGVQGPGGPMGRLKVLPPLGTLGGSIFDAQLRLRDLNAPATPATDNSPVADSESVELLKQLLREANLRTAVSESAFKTITDFKANTVPFLGAFAKGGVALVGERGPELAHMPSGTRVHSAADTQQMLAPKVDVKVIHYGGGDFDVMVNDQKIVAAVERVTRRQARSGGRPLPGRGGGMT